MNKKFNAIRFPTNAATKILKGTPDWSMKKPQMTTENPRKEITDIMEIFGYWNDHHVLTYFFVQVWNIKMALFY